MSYNLRYSLIALRQDTNRQKNKHNNGKTLIVENQYSTSPKALTL